MANVRSDLGTTHKTTFLTQGIWIKLSSYDPICSNKTLKQATKRVQKKEKKKKKNEVGYDFRRYKACTLHFFICNYLACPSSELSL